MEDHPAPNPAKLLAQWMEWETGETPPGRVMANLKTGGLRILLEQLVDAAAASAAEPIPVDIETSAWTPIV
jgi:hypothetical protein